MTYPKIGSISSGTLRTGDLLEAFADELEYLRCERNDRRAGVDFWLTRNGHGAGFWDGGWPEHSDELTKLSKPYGSVDLYIGDDGLIHGT